MFSVENLKLFFKVIKNNQAISRSICDIQAYLGPSKTCMAEFVCKNSKLFSQKAPSQMFDTVLNRPGNHSFSAYTKSSEKLTCLTPCYTDQGVRNVSYSKYFAYVLNE